MNFDLSDDQRMLKDSVERFIADRYDFEARHRHMKQPDGWSRDVWREMAELGLLALPFAEDDGGLGGGGVEMMIVMEALGRGLVVEPYLSTVVLAGGLLRLAGSAAQKAEYIPAIASGERLMALAYVEPHGPRHASETIRATAQRDGDGWVIDGEKAAVLNGDCADEIIVSAATPAGVSLFIVPGDASGLTRKGAEGYDGRRVATLRLDGVRVGADALLGPEGEGAQLLARLETEALAALAAEGVGAMALAFDTTIDYLKTRQQFGVAIGTFQALQHRAADMLISLELARSVAILAALSLGRDEGTDVIAAAKVQIGRSGRFIGQQAVQMHGAIGITDEYKVGHAFKRLTAIDALFGDADHHLDRIADAGGLIDSR